MGILQVFFFRTHSREEHSMDQYQSRLKLSEDFEPHWSIQISGEIHMDQSLVHTFSWGNSYGPTVLKVLPPTLALVHGWLLPAQNEGSKMFREMFGAFSARNLCLKKYPERRAYCILYSEKRKIL